MDKILREQGKLTRDFFTVKSVWAVLCLPQHCVLSCFTTDHVLKRVFQYCYYFILVVNVWYFYPDVVLSFNSWTVCTGKQFCRGETWVTASLTGDAF